MGVAPNIVVVAGPNGSGKSTVAPSLLREYLGVTEFVNADTIAKGLSGFNSDAVALRAGRIMLMRLRELASARKNFAFETTLASRSFAPWVTGLREIAGYRVHMVFLWLPSADMAVGRVAVRVQQGGHAVDESTVRRRYERGLRNFFQVYLPVVDSWTMYDTSEGDRVRRLAGQKKPSPPEVTDAKTWHWIQEAYA